eukprot:scaffold76_cov118-Isochrysis_galbana.AAC.1
MATEARRSTCGSAVAAVNGTRKIIALISAAGSAPAQFCPSAALPVAGGAQPEAPRVSSFPHDGRWSVCVFSLALGPPEVHSDCPYTWGSRGAVCALGLGLLAVPRFPNAPPKAEKFNSAT